jgi:hypothetical protein
MTTDTDFLEDTEPAIPPNAGHHVDLHWTDADRRRFSDRLRRKYPNVIFVEEFRAGDHKNENFKPRFFKHLDETIPGENTKILFPPPGWQPELVHIKDHRLPHWSWKNYLSPIITLMLRHAPDRLSRREDWIGDAADAPIQVWRGINISTSYRRELEVERRIQSAVLRLAASLSRQLVPILWESYADYCARNGKIALVWLRSGRNFASHAVIDWAHAEPRREIDLSVWHRRHYGVSWHPPEDVDDAWWGDVHKPKWAQR